MRNTERKVVLCKAVLNEQNHGTKPMISKCKCCNKPMLDPVFSMADPKQPNGFWYENEHLNSHEATVKVIGNKASKSTMNMWFDFTVASKEVACKEYILSANIFEGLNVTDRHIHNLYESVEVVNYCGTNKFFSGLVAFGCNRNVNITFTNGFSMKVRMENVNDAIGIANELFKVKKANSKAELLEALKKIAKL